jgi:hypothetical protein
MTDGRISRAKANMQKLHTVSQPSPYCLVLARQGRAWREPRGVQSPRAPEKAAKIIPAVALREDDFRVSPHLASRVSTRVSRATLTLGLS